MFETCAACKKRVKGRAYSAIIDNAIKVSLHRSYDCLRRFFEYLENQGKTAGVIYDDVVVLYVDGKPSNAIARDKAPMWKRFIGKFIPSK